MQNLRVIALIGTFFSPLAFGADGYYESKERGWFWYEREPEVVEEPEPVKPEPPEVVVAPPPPEEPEPVKPEPTEQVVRLDSAWLRDNMNDRLMKAIDDPSPENIKVFLYMQRLMVERSAAFAKASQEAYATSPWLTNDARRPSAQGARAIMNKQAAKETRDLIKEVGKETRIYLLVDSQCYECTYQINSIRAFTSKGIDVVISSMDDKLPAGIDPAVTTPKSQLPENVVNFPFKRAPALIAVHKDSQPVHLSASLLAGSDLERNLLLVAKHHGWITTRQFAKTKPNREVELAVSSSTELPAALVNDSAAFVEYLKSQVQVDYENENY